MTNYEWFKNEDGTMYLYNNDAADMVAEIRTVKFHTGMKRILTLLPERSNFPRVEQDDYTVSDAMKSVEDWFSSFGRECNFD